MEGKYALEELQANYKSRDLIKGKLVVDYLDKIDSGDRKRILFELIKLDNDFAIPLLAHLEYKHPTIIDDNPHLKDVLLEKSIASPDQLLKNLVKLSPETVIFVELIERTRLKEALPRLRQLLNQTDDKQLLTAAIHALGALGDENAVNPVGEFLYFEDNALKIESIYALGEIGTEEALNMLHNSLGRDSQMDGIILDLFKKLQTEMSINYLNETLVSASADIRTLGKTKLSEIGSKAIPFLTANLQKNDPDLQIHSLNILLEIGDESAVKGVRQLLNTEPENDNVRFAAFETLAHLPGLKGDYLLATGLTDKDDSIRLAAAKAVEKNLDPVIIGGIKNMLNNEDPEAVRIIKAIVDAEAVKLFIKLLDVSFFHRISTEYIATKVHETVRNTFLETLKDAGIENVATYIEQTCQEQQQPATRPLICAVDDSAMILSIYRRILNELGYEPVLFEYPEEGLAWLADNKPIAVFTDLNMPKITGIELAKRIRKQYDSATLPIIMVTTQQEGRDNDELTQAGINKVMSKPFGPESVQSALSELLISS